jgi:hypothetical protein
MEPLMTFRVTGLDPAPFRQFAGLDDRQLAALGMRRYVADSKPGFPDRIELRDAEPGERVLLLNYVHQPAATPYRASHAIFILENATARYDRIGEIPEPLRVRPVSLRAFDCAHDMIDADLIEGRGLEGLITKFLSNPKTAYLQAHYARRGCYAARIERA